MSYATPAGSARYYFHGDQHEHGAPAGYYCARCDLFEQWPHFRPGGCPHERPGRDDFDMVGHGRAVLRDNRKRYAQGRARVQFTRPTNAPTVWGRQL